MSLTHPGLQVVPLDVEGLGFTDFLIDSGTSSTLITSSLRTELGVSPVDGQVTTGALHQALWNAQPVLGSRQVPESSSNLLHKCTLTQHP